MDLYPWIIPGLPPCLLKTAGRWRPACCSSRAWIIGTGSILFKLLGRDRARAGNEPGAQSSAQMKPQQLAWQGSAQGWVFQAQKAFPRPVLAPCAPVLFTAKAFGGIRTLENPSGCSTVGAQVAQTFLEQDLRELGRFYCPCCPRMCAHRATVVGWDSTFKNVLFWYPSVGSGALKEPGLAENSSA